MPEILGIQTLKSVDRIPKDSIDVAMICLGPKQTIAVLPELAERESRQDLSYRVDFVRVAPKESN